MRRHCLNIIPGDTQLSASDREEKLMLLFFWRRASSIPSVNANCQHPEKTLRKHDDCDSEREKVHYLFALMRCFKTHALRVSGSKTSGRRTYDVKRTPLIGHKCFERCRPRQSLASNPFAFLPPFLYSMRYSDVKTCRGKLLPTCDFTAV